MLLHVPAGRVVVVQGETGDRYYIVDRGTVAVSVDKCRVAVLSDGEAFGEIALLHERPRTATVTASTAAGLWALEGAVFVAALRSDADRGLAAADEVPPPACNEQPRLVPALDRPPRSRTRRPTHGSRRALANRSGLEPIDVRWDRAQPCVPLWWPAQRRPKGPSDTSYSGIPD